LANLYWPALAGILAQRFQMTILNFPLKALVLFDIEHLILFLMSWENRREKILLNGNALVIVSVVADKEQQSISIFHRNKMDDSCITSYDL